jgi:hypothetical protein
MSLMRLLSAGKSWVGMSDNAGRYQVTRQRLLPKFGRGANPFQPGAPAVESEPAPAPAAAASEPVKALKTTQVIPELAAQPVRPALAAPAVSWWKRLAGVFRFRPGRPAAAAVRLPRKAVQAELTLESVKVVRNDLSDADLDVVPANVKAPAPVAVAPAVAVAVRPAPVVAAVPAPAPMPVAENSNGWRRAATRLIGMGRG